MLLEYTSSHRYNMSSRQLFLLMYDILDIVLGMTISTTYVIIVI